MTLYRKLETYREIYNEATDQDRAAVDEAVGRLVISLADYGFDVPHDDRLENVVTAVVKYLVESGNAI